MLAVCSIHDSTEHAVQDELAIQVAVSVNVQSTNTNLVTDQLWILATNDAVRGFMPGCAGAHKT